MKAFRVGIVGCGFWSRFQVAGWLEHEGVEIAGVYNRTREKAGAIADRFGLPRSAVYDDPGVMIDEAHPDVIDIVTDVGTHERFTALAAERGVPVICQKPMAPDLAAARRMVALCVARKVPFHIHENWRWQSPIREVARALSEDGLGKPFRARISFVTSFPVFDNQPFLRELDRFIIADIGSHVLDTARFLFGDATRLSCETHRVNQGIRGEDVATVMMRTARDVTVTCEMSYASPVEHDLFPQTFVFVECERGSVELGPDYTVKVTDRSGTTESVVPVVHYPWADPAYDLVHESIVACNGNLLGALRDGETAETTARDNLETVATVFAAYESAQSGQVVTISAKG